MSPSPWQPVSTASLLLLTWLLPLWTSTAHAAVAASAPTLYEGSPCKLADGSRGQCIPMTKCPSALAQFKQDRRNFRPKRCGFQGFVEVICCADVPLRRAEEACRDFTNEINPSLNLYIYGGEVAQPGEFPHMVGTKDVDFAEPFEERPDDLPTFRAPPPGAALSRQPPPGTPPPSSASDRLTAPAPPSTSTSGVTDDEVTSPEGDAVNGGSEQLSGRTGLAGLTGFIGGLRDEVRRHRDRLTNWHRDRVRNLHNHLFPGSPSTASPDPRPVPVTPTPTQTTAVPDDDAYGSLIDPRGGPRGAQPAQPAERVKEAFDVFDEDTTSRPRLVAVSVGAVNATSASATSEGKAGPPGNWRVPPDSVWARPPSTPSPPSGPSSGTSSGPASAMSEGKVGNNEVVLYVIGGDETRPDDFKHMVALGYKEKGSSVFKWDCGGSLISNEHVLTAAHCVTNPRRGKPSRVRVGAHNLTEPSSASSSGDGGRELAVLDVAWHPEYSVKSHYHDVAVLRIERVAFDDRVQPACLYTRARAPDTGMVATGWGVTDIDQLDQTSEVLMKAAMDQVPLSRCNASFTKTMSSRLARGVRPEQICARGTNGVADTCLGDSGGPLQVLENPVGLYSIVGITSFGQLCGGLGVYARVSAYLDWIEDVVWPGNSSS